MNDKEIIYQNKYIYSPSDFNEKGNLYPPVSGCPCGICKRRIKTRAAIDAARLKANPNSKRVVLPEDAKERKQIPLYSGLVKYFPDALVAVAKLSFKGNEQHNPGTPLHWDRKKSGDELDAMMRHVVGGEWDAVAWRALAHLQKQLEK
jgi:hypothetical protein